MNFSPVFALGLLAVLLVAVVAAFFFVAFINIAMFIGPALIVVVALVALYRVGSKTPTR